MRAAKLPVGRESPGQKQSPERKRVKGISPHTVADRLFREVAHTYSNLIELHTSVLWNS